MKVSYRLSSLLTEVKAHGWTKERESEVARILDAVQDMERAALPSGESATLGNDAPVTYRDVVERVVVEVGPLQERLNNLDAQVEFLEEQGKEWSDADVRLAAQIAEVREMLGKVVNWGLGLDHTMVPVVTELDGIIEEFLGTEEMKELRGRARRRLRPRAGVEDAGD